MPKIVKVVDKYRIKKWGLFGGSYLDRRDLNYWWYGMEYAEKYCNFDSLEAAEKGWEEYKLKTREEFCKTLE